MKYICEFPAINGRIMVPTCYKNIARRKKKSKDQRSSTTLSTFYQHKEYTQNNVTTSFANEIQGGVRAVRKKRNF
jgi:hypothetical protein